MKYSLLEISRAINGDGKSSPDPLFKVEVVLQPGRHNVPTVSIYIILSMLVAIEFILDWFITFLRFYSFIL